MANIVKSADKLIGKTPLLELDNFAKAYDVPATILGKLEYLNPTGSVKDRAALYMINDAEKAGRLKPGGTIIEPTSGNTGIGIASVGAARGYKVIIVMPETMTKERRDMISAYGADIVLTDGKSGMSGAVAKAKAMVNEIEGSIILSQFENPSNAQAHYETTGPEIWDDTDGKVDIFIAGVGTGGTVTGVGKYLKEKNPNVKIVAVEPQTSSVLSGGKPGPHKIQGIGAGFVPDVLDTSVYDEILPISNEASYEAARKIATTQGVMLGISSGAKLTVSLAMIGLLSRGRVIGSTGMIFAAFLGAMLSMGFVLVLAQRVRQMSLLIIAGVMVGYICSAVTDFIVTFAEDSNIVNLHNWSQGSFSGISWDNVRVMTPVVLVSLLCAFLLSKPMGAYQLGEGCARSMGVNIRLFRASLILLSRVLSACVAAFAGPISFVGIAVPQLMKGLFGTAKPLVQIPACFAGGAVFCLFCDLVARTVFAPTELSISSVTAILGAPVVIFIMVRRRTRTM